MIRDHPKKLKTPGQPEAGVCVQLPTHEREYKTPSTSISEWFVSAPIPTM